MGREEHGGLGHGRSSTGYAKEEGEAILKTSSTIYSTNRSSSSTRPAKLQLDRAENFHLGKGLLGIEKPNIKRTLIQGVLRAR
ncbi:unnamed protein product [Microthlaspi erraticum]|uniref:Uncharacterized protein n=1 Tax=Microthlaspi erraticum TaxID=1685480 RepID=A0A6D2IJM9_9BRAS|nr:unnamed protein product [Microthlaspi erraticum]